MPREAISNNFATSYDPQSACPLFTRIPPEIRNSIFKLALTEYDDTDHPYEEETTYCRPDYYFPHRIDTDLLRTCRRIYLEAHLLPVALNEHVFWCYRGPPGRKYAADPQGYFELMTPQQLDAVDCVHFFTQQFWLEGRFADACRLSSMRPRKIKITLRHSDWWVWEVQAKLGIDPRLAGRVMWDEMGRKPRTDEGELGFGYQFRHLHGLRELEMEFETSPLQIAELENIVQRALAWRFDLLDGNVLSTEGTAVVRYLWVVGMLRGQQCYFHDDWYPGFDAGSSSEATSEDDVLSTASNDLPDLINAQNSDPMEGVDAAPVPTEDFATHSESSYDLRDDGGNASQDGDWNAEPGFHQVSPPDSEAEAALPPQTAAGSSIIPIGPNILAPAPPASGLDQRSGRGFAAFFIYKVRWLARPRG